MANSTNEQQNSEFLREIWRGAQWAYLWRSIPENERNGADDPRHGESLWFRVDRTPELPTRWRDVYFGVHPCKAPGSVYERTGREAWRVGAVNCMFADFDHKSFDNGLDGIMAHLDALPLYPSVTVATGGGVHCYWIFSTPVIVKTTEARERVARAQRLWVDVVVKADPAAKDLGRILRLPGTHNYKYEPPRPVTIIDGAPIRRWHDAPVIAEILRPIISQEDERNRAKADAAMEAAKKSPMSWRKLYEWALQDASKGARHKTALRLAFRLKEAGAPESVAQELVQSLINATIDDRPTHNEAKQVTKHAYR